MHTQDSKIIVDIDADAVREVATWRGPNGTLKLIFADGYEETHRVSGDGRKTEFVVGHTGTLRDVYFASDNDPMFWYSVGTTWGS